MLLTDIDVLISNVNVTMGDAYLTGIMTDFFSPVKAPYSYGGKKEKDRRKTIKFNQNDLFVQCRNGGRQLKLSA